MKTLIALAAATTALFTFGAPRAQAGPSHGSCRVLSTCSYCHRPVYSYYRPVRYVNHCAVYGWVPSYHTSCQRHSGLSVRFSTGLSSRSCSPVRVYNYGYSSTPSLRILNYSRPLRSYHSTRSFPTTYGPSYRRCR